MVGCLSVCLSHHLTAVAACVGFAAEHRDSSWRQAPRSNSAAAWANNTTCYSTADVGSAMLTTRVDEAEHRFVINYYDCSCC